MSDNSTQQLPGERDNDALFGTDVKTVTREQAAKQEFGIEIAVESVPLPSKGLVYPPGSPLHQRQSVEFRAMTTREEDILMSPALIKKGTVVTELIKSCLIDKTIDVPSMLVGDRTALMIGVRATGYSAEYTPTVICPQCQTKSELNVDLNDLPLKMLDLTPVEPFKNIFEFTLPRSKKNVKFQFVTGLTEEMMIKDMNARKKKGFENSNMVTNMLQHYIVEIDGDSSRSFINKFIQVMPAMDSSALRQYINDHEPGIDMTYEFECRSIDCEHAEKISIPIDGSFFWPNSVR